MGGCGSKENHGIKLEGNDDDGAGAGAGAGLYIDKRGGTTDHDKTQNTKNTWIEKTIETQGGSSHSLSQTQEQEQEQKSFPTRQQSKASISTASSNGNNNAGMVGTMAPFQSEVDWVDNKKSSSSSSAGKKTNNGTKFEVPIKNLHRTQAVTADDSFQDDQGLDFDDFDSATSSHHYHHANDDQVSLAANGSVDETVLKESSSSSFAVGNSTLQKHPSNHSASSTSSYEEIFVDSDDDNEFGVESNLEAMLDYSNNSAYEEEVIDDATYEAFIDAKQKSQGRFSYDDFLEQQQEQQQQQEQMESSIPTSLSRVVPDSSVKSLGIDGSFSKRPASSTTTFEVQTLKSTSVNDINEPAPITPSRANPLKLAAHLRVPIDEEEDVLSPQSGDNFQMPNSSIRNVQQPTQSNKWNHDGRPSPPSSKKTNNAEGSFTGLELQMNGNEEGTSVDDYLVSPLTTADPSAKSGFFLEVQGANDPPLVSPITLKGSEGSGKLRQKTEGSKDGKSKDEKKKTKKSSDGGKARKKNSKVDSSKNPCDRDQGLSDRRKSKASKSPPQRKDQVEESRNKNDDEKGNGKHRRRKDRHKSEHAPPPPSDDAKTPRIQNSNASENGPMDKAKKSKIRRNNESKDEDKKQEQRSKSKRQLGDGRTKQDLPKDDTMSVATGASGESDLSQPIVLTKSRRNMTETAKSSSSNANDELDDTNRYPKRGSRMIKYKPRPGSQRNLEKRDQSDEVSVDQKSIESDRSDFLKRMDALKTRLDQAVVGTSASEGLSSGKDSSTGKAVPGATTNADGKKGGSDKRKSKKGESSSKGKMKKDDKEKSRSSKTEPSDDGKAKDGGKRKITTKKSKTKKSSSHKSKAT